MRNARRFGLWLTVGLVVPALAACGSSSKGAGPPATNPPTTGAPTTQPGPQLYEGEFTVLADPSHGPHLCTNVMTSLPPQCGGLPVTNWDWDAVQGEEQVRGTTWGGWHVTGTYADGRFTLVGRPTEPAPDSDEPDGNSLDPNDTVDFSPACDEPVGDPSVGVAEWEAMSQSAAWPPHDDRIVTAWVTDPRGSAKGDAFVANAIVRPGAKDEIESRIRGAYAGLVCVVEQDAPSEEELSAVQRELTDDATRRALGGLTDSSQDGRRGVVVAHVWVVSDDALGYAQERWGDLVELRGNLTPVD